MAGPEDWGATPAQEGPEAWGAQPAGRQGGLLQLPQAIPKFVETLTSPGGLSKFAGAAYQSLIGSFFEHKPITEGMDSEEETATGLMGALFMLGRPGGAFLRESAKVAAPVIKQFNDAVVAPNAQRIESFARVGDPNGVRLDPPGSETRPAQIQPIADSPFAGVPRSILAKTDDPIVNSVLNDPVVKNVIDNALVDRTRTIPYEAGGSIPLNRPTTYVDKHVPQTFTVKRVSDPSKTITFDTAEPTIIHENAEEAAMDILIKAGMPADAAYRYSHFQIAEVAEHAWYRANDIDPAAAEAEWKKIQPGIQHEIANDTPPDLYHKEYPGGDVTKARHEQVFEAGPTPEEIAQGNQILSDHYAKQPVSAIPMLEEARQLGVIGLDAPENINLSRLAEREKDTPAEAAFRAVPPQPLGAAVTPKEMRGSMGHAPGSYNAKGKEWVSKIDAPESAREAIERIAQSYDWYPESRAGTPSPASRAAVAEAAGIDPKDIDSKYFGEHFDNDAKVRAVIQALRETTQDFMEASDRARREPTEENAAALLEAETRHGHVLEYTMGKRAESGRSLNTWKELLREQERARATVKLKSGEATGEVPTGVSDLVEAAGKVRANLNSPKQGELGLGKLIDAARNLVDAQEKAPQTRKALTDVAKRARAAAKEAETGIPTGFDKLIEEAKELAKTLPQPPKEIGKPEPQGLASMISEAQRAVTKTGAPGAVTKLISLAEQAERLAMTMPRTPEEAAAKMPADLASLVKEANKTLNAVKGRRPDSALDNLVAQAERDVTAQAKQKPGQRAELPPEWQALVDKADFVTKRFGGIAKGEEAALLLAQAGRTAAEQAEIARGVEGLTPNQIARVLQKLRDHRDPHWTYALIVQGLISGLVTHTFYPIINALQSVVDRVLAPELAAITGRLAGQDKSLLAPIHAGMTLIRSFPDSIAGASQAFKTGMRIPLESELRLAARGEKSPEAAGAKTPYGAGLRINWGTFKPENFWGRVLRITPEGLDKAAQAIGVPGRFANAQHTFFKFANERASLAQQAYEKAAFEERPGSQKFWERYQYHIDNPTDEMLSAATTDGYSGTFMDKLGERTQRLASLVRDTPAKWVIFFTHIPFKIVQRGIENSPVALLHMLSQTKTGMALKGELGSDAAHLAWAHVTLGTAFAAYIMNKALGGQVTGDYPADQKERDRWRDLGIQPNSFQAGGQWWSLSRFGSIGLSARMAANWAQDIQHYRHTPDDTAMHLGFALALGTANSMIGDVGFETVKGLVDVLEDRQKADQFAAYHLASLAQPVSMLSQAASFSDPFMREAHTLMDGMKARLPLLRQTLLPKRDAVFGEPVPNPGYHTILRSSAVNANPIKAEMERLNYFPAPPQKTIGGVRLTDEQYDRYEATAGPLVKQLLTNEINRPGYRDMRPEAQIERLKGLVSVGREKARMAMQHYYPELIKRGIDDRHRAIAGQ